MGDARELVSRIRDEAITGTAIELESIVVWPEEDKDAQPTSDFFVNQRIDLLVRGLGPLTNLIGLPAEALPMAILRPLSGSGAFAVMAEILEAEGPDSFVGLLASTLQGSTETTFYVLTLYCGAAGVREVRHALPACLMGDLAGAAGATAACHWFFA